MSIYTSPHDDPFFGPPPEWDEVHHCEKSSKDDNIPSCTVDEFCECECDECQMAVLDFKEKDIDPPEYDKYESDDFWNED